MIVFDFKDLIALALLALCAVVFLVIAVIDRIALAVKKRQQKRIDEAHREEEG